MKKFTMLCVVLIVVLLATTIMAGVKNIDKPLKGVWNFNLKKVWSFEKAGETLFGNPRTLLVSDDGNIYLYDIQAQQYHIFADDGKYVKSFAARGEGPGEIKRFLESFFSKDKIVIVEDQMLHYFDKNGTFIKKIQNNFGTRAPWYFFNDDEVISYPLLRDNPAASKTGEIFRVNLKTNQKKVLSTFPVFEGGQARDRGNNTEIKMIIFGLTPMVIVGYDTDRFYYGLNDKYEINAVNYDGKKLNTFSIEGRPKSNISKEDKSNWVKGYKMPEDLLNAALKTIPDDLLYFYRIETINGLIYVHNAYVSHQVPRQVIDIFSRDGKYLYKALINPPENFSIHSGPRPVLAIKNNFLYMVIENEDGDIYLAKYAITLPKS